MYTEDYRLFGPIEYNSEDICNYVNYIINVELTNEKGEIITNDAGEPLTS